MANAHQPAAKKAPRRRGKKIDALARHRMIAEAAYYRAEQDGFSGDALEHWLDAENEIDRLLES